MRSSGVRQEEAVEKEPDLFARTENNGEFCEKARRLRLMLEKGKQIRIMNA